MRRTFDLKKVLLWLSAIIVLFSCGILIWNGEEKSAFFSFFAPKVAEVDLVVGGDIMLSRGIGRWAKKEGYDRIFTGENYHPLSQFSCYLSGSCLLFFNLESPFSLKDNDQPKGGFLFRANPKNLEILQGLRGESQLVLSLANNHTNNAGGAGIALTREVLSGAEIGFFGVGKEKEEARKIYQIEKNGIQICFQAYSYDGNYNRYGGEWLAWNALKKEEILEDLARMEEHGCDVKAFSLHRGAEYRIHPNVQQKELAHALVDAGADLILGGHSHVPGAYEIYKGKPVFYSFGNFIFDQDRGKKARERGFDYIYDYQLKRNTVPTYIPLLAHIKILKKDDEIEILMPEFKMARVDKGVFSPLDSETFDGIIEKIRL